MCILVHQPTAYEGTIWSQDNVKLYNEGYNKAIQSPQLLNNDNHSRGTPHYTCNVSTPFTFALASLVASASAAMDRCIPCGRLTSFLQGDGEEAHERERERDSGRCSRFPETSPPSHSMSTKVVERNNSMTMCVLSSDYFIILITANSLD